MQPNRYALCEKPSGKKSPYRMCWFLAHYFLPVAVFRYGIKSNMFLLSFSPLRRWVISELCKRVISFLGGGLNVSELPINNLHKVMRSAMPR